MLALLDRLRVRKTYSQSKIVQLSHNEIIQTAEIMAPRFPFLGRLPAELVLDIADWLPASSAAALALCNHGLFNVLGRSSLTALSAKELHPNERDMFLQNLDRDSVDSFFCFRCRKLHLLGKSSTPQMRFSTISHSRCEPVMEEYEYEHEKLRSGNDNLTVEHAQVALKLYRHGLYSDLQKYLNHASVTQPKPEVMSLLPGNWGFHFFEPDVVNGQICVRTQSWMFITKARGYILPAVFRHTVCGHMDPNQLEDDPLSSLVQCKLMHVSISEDSCSFCRDLVRCPKCQTDLYVDTRTIKGSPGVNIVIVTKWQCMEMDLVSTKVARGEFSNSLVGSAPGDIRDAFERQARVPFNSILTVEHAWKVIRRDAEFSAQFR